jgi:hypothetical protein
LFPIIAADTYLLCCLGISLLIHGHTMPPFYADIDQHNSCRKNPSYTSLVLRSSSSISW